MEPSNKASLLERIDGLSAAELAELREIAAGPKEPRRVGRFRTFEVGGRLYVARKIGRNSTQGFGRLDRLGQLLSDAGGSSRECAPAQPDKDTTRAKYGLSIGIAFETREGRENFERALRVARVVTIAITIVLLVAALIASVDDWYGAQRRACGHRPVGEAPAASLAGNGAKSPENTPGEGAQRCVRNASESDAIRTRRVLQRSSPVRLLRFPRESEATSGRSIGGRCDAPEAAGLDALND